jgi:hypothetical protein
MKLINKNTNEIINVSFAYIQENLIAYGKTDYLEVPTELEDCTCLKVEDGVVIEDVEKQTEEDNLKIYTELDAIDNDSNTTRVIREAIINGDIPAYEAQLSKMQELENRAIELRGQING